MLARTREDDIDVLAEAHTVIGIGKGVAPEEYDQLEPLRALLGAELAATRKVTDKGWLPRSRQVGITGRAVAPRLFVSIGASGKFNHAVGVRAAGTVLAINADPDAPIFATADVGIVGDWHDVLPLLVEELSARATIATAADATRTRRVLRRRSPEHGEQHHGAADADHQRADRAPTSPAPRSRSRCRSTTPPARGSAIAAHATARLRTYS